MAERRKARALRPAEQLLAPIVAAAIAELELTPADAAVVRLAEEYAARLDEAAHLAHRLAVLAERADDPAEAYRLLGKVQAQTVLSDLGPKLLAALAALGATPAARARIRSGAGGGAPRAAGGLAALREAHRA